MSFYVDPDLAILAAISNGTASCSLTLTRGEKMALVVALKLTALLIGMAWPYMWVR